MNWFSKRISKKNTTPSSTNKKPSDQSSPKITLVCSKPISENQEKISEEIFKRLIPLKNLDAQCIDLLPYSTQIFADEAIIFIRKQTAENVYYLLEGIIELQPDSDNSYQISAESTRAHLPLDSGKIRGATATAKTQVTLLVISSELTQLWAEKSNAEVSCIELIDINLPEQINDQRFFSSFTEAYRANKLTLPSLPTVAFKLKEAMKENIGVNEAVEIIQLDPPIVTKLIQVANSPLYAPTTPITNCHDAVTRLGLDATRNLVMGISLKQLFQCKDKQLMKGMQQVWKNSLYISSLSFVLAAESGIINPDDALLAGLISDIGIIPLIHFAEQYPEDYPSFSELEEAIPYLSGSVGMLVLHTLGFSEELCNIPHYAEDWLYDSGDDFCLTDIVILAKLHSNFGTKKSKSLPYINSIPAYAKLKNGKLGHDFSLNILTKAKERVNAAMSMLRSED